MGVACPCHRALVVAPPPGRMPGGPGHPTTGPNPSVPSLPPGLGGALLVVALAKLLWPVRLATRLVPLGHCLVLWVPECMGWLSATTHKGGGASRACWY